MRLLLILLLFLYTSVAVDNKYPSCDNKILIVYGNTFYMNSDNYGVLTNFMREMLFRSWNHYEGLGLLPYGSAIRENYGSFKRFYDVNRFISQQGQFDVDGSICSALKHIYVYEIPFVNVILFITEFHKNGISSDCKRYIMSSNFGADSITFVLLNININVDVMSNYFPGAYFILWDIENEVAPKNWEKLFNHAYNCGDKETKVHSIETTAESFEDRQCKQIIIAYDKSASVDDAMYKKQQDLLMNDVFSNWECYDDLALWSFATNVTANRYGELKDKDAVTNFIQNDEKTASELDFCTIFYYLEAMNLRYSVPNVVLFVSKFEEEDFDGMRCQATLNFMLTKFNSLTFVALTKDMEFDEIRFFFPNAQFIQLDLTNNIVPKNWDWFFWTATGCNENTGSKTYYPCGSRIVMALDTSESLTAGSFEKQKSFLISNVFDNTWTNFNNLALLGYDSRNVELTDFGMLNSLEQIHNTIANYKQQTRGSPSLCVLFKKLTTMYLKTTNLVVFVSKFIKQRGFCESYASVIRANANGILFVTMSKSVDSKYLQYVFPHARFLDWNIATDQVPTNWAHVFASSYGCDDYVINANEYPCNNRILIGFDYSFDLSPRAYQKQLNFLLNRVFIPQWTYVDVSVFSYEPDSSRIRLYFGKFAYLPNIKTVIRNSQQIYQKIDICDVLKVAAGYDYTTLVNSILFLTKFNEEPDWQCQLAIDQINRFVANITLFALSPAVNKTFLKKLIPRANFIDWEIEKEDEPTDWPQKLWSAFGCSGSTPISLPKITGASTVKSTPRLSTALKTTEIHPPTTTEISVQSTTHQTFTQSTILSTTSLATQSSKTSIGLYLGIFIPLAIILLTVLIVLGFWRYGRQKQKAHQEFVRNMPGRCSKISNDLEPLDPWEIRTKNVVVSYDDKLGSGNFGEVYIAQLIGDSGIKRVYNNVTALQHFCDCTVAVKMLPSSADDEAKQEFQDEVDFMQKLKFHVHLITMLGYAKNSRNLLLVMEYCENGDLLHYVRAHKNQIIQRVKDRDDAKVKTFISFAWQISDGLEYLESLGLIHRDVAARNIMLDDGNTCKIGDFGHSRSIEDKINSNQNEKFPLRWMSLESLRNNEFSTKTDVFVKFVEVTTLIKKLSWSYAVVLYEIFTLGDTPYSGLENDQILTFLELDKRLEQPTYSSNKIYDLMLSCWEEDAERRPSFTNICQFFSEILENVNLLYNYIDAINAPEEQTQNNVKEFCNV